MKDDELGGELRGFKKQPRLVQRLLPVASRRLVIDGKSVDIGNPRQFEPTDGYRQFLTTETLAELAKRERRP